jgi:glycosyltransferase involved in cell wall biosynthesis
MRILVTCPHLKLPGGVSNFYNVLRNNFSIEVDLFEIGARKKKESELDKLRHLWIDYVGFRNYIKNNACHIGLVHLNPSFDYKAVVRDGLLLRSARRFGQKTLVMFHGWNYRDSKAVREKFSRLFVSTYRQADGFIVLGSEFKRELRRWGFKQPIYLETTPVDDELLEGFSIEAKINRIEQKRDINLLFLSRVEKEKGIIEAIETIKYLSKVYPGIRLTVAGEGSFLKKAIEFGDSLGLRGSIFFTGHVVDNEKRETFLDSDIYIFPTYHGEGMPTSVLEAMAFGLPVVSRPVGGLQDFFVNGEHGFLEGSLDSRSFASVVGEIISNKGLWKRMSFGAHEFARNRFMASRVAERLEHIYGQTIGD